MTRPNAIRTWKEKYYKHIKQLFSWQVRKIRNSYFTNKWENYAIVIYQTRGTKPHFRRVVFDEICRICCGNIFPAGPRLRSIELSSSWWKSLPKRRRNPQRKRDARRGGAPGINGNGEKFDAMKLLDIIRGGHISVIKQGRWCLGASGGGISPRGRRGGIGISTSTRGKPLTGAITLMPCLRDALYLWRSSDVIKSNPQRDVTKEMKLSREIMRTDCVPR